MDVVVAHKPPAAAVAKEMTAVITVMTKRQCHSKSDFSSGIRISALNRLNSNNNNDNIDNASNNDLRSS